MFLMKRSLLVSRFFAFSFLASLSAHAAQSTPLFTIDGKAFSSTDLTPAEQNKLHELEMNKFKLIESMARQRYVEAKVRPHEKLNSDEKPFAAEEKWLNQSFTPGKADIDKALEDFKDEKQLQSLSTLEKRNVISRYLGQQKRSKALMEATDKALSKGEIRLVSQAPVAPTFVIKPGTQAVLGDVQAPIRVVEFTDFQCPYCKKLSGVTQEVLRKHGRVIAWEVRHFPLSFHKQARAASAAVYCASMQGKLEQAKKWVFDAQEKLTQEGVFSEMAKSLSLNTETFDACRKADATEKIIQADIKEGERVGVSGTPTVFVNGRRFEGDVQSVEAWDKLVQTLLKNRSNSPTL